ncbi:MerR family transcriptional regulator [Janthinobacterium sp. GW460P]|uniref:MerR family transcriptional regulator n=1 Tax=unclassified Janthinobacterium TaxID=2610881 RepID=UPI000A3205C4|nr:MULTISPECIES: MerR family transcriptional regulator [unclassified Janthinobacterium]MCC7701484.1 MerR family transcriptional regulator [Janthinobacterium sp. GW460P]MCC7706991.1 MerR family transcriptional regulator [Janthinobacterium sp. GW460W]
MLLKIGELARLTGLTIRTLHHYDSIGLLSPSGRTQAGYRLYQHGDMDRLHRIMALRKFGLSLADIANALAGPDLPLSAIVARQIAMLDHQIAQASTLRVRLQGLQAQLGQGQAPELTEWLTTMELMTMYDKYFSAEELQQLPLLSDAAVEQEWKALVARVRALQGTGATPDDARAQALATEWMVKLVRDTGAHPGLFARLNNMHAQEPSMQHATSVDADLMRFILGAFNASRMALYKPFLDEQEYAHLVANYGKRSGEWPALIAAVRAAIDARTPPTDPAVLQLARQWLELFRAYAGNNPATQLKFRQAHQQEPRLMEGSFVDAAMLQYLGAAMAIVAQEKQG